MCGICGKWISDSQGVIPEAEIVRMTETLGHRGPDEKGIYLDKTVGFGHRRLSIIDLEVSKQPMCNEDGSIWIVYNGEIYNFPELRDYLIAQGHKFKTKGDTEVIIHLYEQLGEECVKELRGMFAFAIWDARAEKLFLARDRLGIKPLHYYWDGNQFLFGSEIKSIIENPGVRAEIDLTSLHHFLSFLYVPAPQSMFSGIKKLLPAHTLTLKNGELSINKYWEFKFNNRFRKSEAYYGERLREMLTEAVKIRLIADVPLGAFLSGGIDSSIVVGIMSTLCSQPVKTFSIGFSELEYNEASDARIVAQHFHTDHTELILNPQTIRTLIPELLCHFDEPFGDSSAFPTYFVSKLASEKVKVALSGDGGDELFGGYYWWHKRPAYQLLLNKFPKSAKTLLYHAGKAVPENTKGKYFLKHFNKPYDRFLLNSKAVFDEGEREKLYTGILKRELEGKDAFYFNMKILNEISDGNWMNKLQTYDVMTYLPNDILVKVDMMSMYNSLEVRVPILDHKFVEFAGTIPPDLRIKDGVSKYILKKSMSHLLPQSILNKKKQGFCLPLAKWLTNDLREHVFDTLLDKTTEQRGYFNKIYIEKMLSGRIMDDKRAHRILALFAVELWLRKYVG